MLEALADHDAAAAPPPARAGGRPRASSRPRCWAGSSTSSATPWCWPSAPTRSSWRSRRGRSPGSRSSIERWPVDSILAALQILDRASDPAARQLARPTARRDGTGARRAAGRPGIAWTRWSSGSTALEAGGPAVTRAQRRHPQKKRAARAETAGSPPAATTPAGHESEPARARVRDRRPTRRGSRGRPARRLRLQARPARRRQSA